MKRFFYYNKTKAQQGKKDPLWISDTKLTPKEIQKINEENKNILTDYIIYESEYPIMVYPIVDGETLREATDKELVDLGIITLKDGEIIEGDNIKKIPQPSWQYKWVVDKWLPDETKLIDGQYIEGETIKEIPYDYSLGYVVPKWNKDTRQWYEGSNEHELLLAQYNEYYALNNPLRVDDMKTNGLYEEWNTLMRDMEAILFNDTGVEAYKTTTIAKGIPNVSDELKQFKEKFKLIK